MTTGRILRTGLDRFQFNISKYLQWPTQNYVEIFMQNGFKWHTDEGEKRSTKLYFIPKNIFLKEFLSQSQIPCLSLQNVCTSCPSAQRHCRTQSLYPEHSHISRKLAKWGTQQKTHPVYNHEDNIDYIYFYVRTQQWSWSLLRVTVQVNVCTNATAD